MSESRDSSFEVMHDGNVELVAKSGAFRSITDFSQSTIGVTGPD